MRTNPIPLLGLAFVALIVGACASGAASPSSGGAGPSASASAAPAATTAPFGDPVGAVRCDYGGHDDAYHIHVMIRIRIDGVVGDPDDDIGVDGSRCMYWVHTHDATGGVTHVEAPENVKVTLGDFIAVWQATYPDSPTLAKTLELLEKGELVVDRIQTPADWRSVVLTDTQLLEVG